MKFHYAATLAVLVTMPLAAVTTSALAQNDQRSEQNMRNAENPPQNADEQARVRTEGAAGGTGNPVAKGEGKRDAITGKTNRHDIRPQSRPGREHDESSSDRQAGRGAR